MSDLLRYFETNPGRLIYKWMHYFSVYERHFSRYRGKPVKMLEIGVFHGGSLQMWKHYFGAQTHIIGVDVNPACAAFEEPGIQIEIGDQADRVFLKSLRDKHGPFDIVLDDGGHRAAQQIASFEELFPAVREGGLYAVEDTHTSYWSQWGGGLRRPGTFAEYSKQFVDDLHAYFAEQPQHTPGVLRNQCSGVHFYDSILLLEKRAVPPPVVRITGEPSFPIGAHESLLLARHEMHRGRNEVARQRCLEALAAEPSNRDAMQLLAELDGLPAR
ncbi:MAG: class I SAM-dependent methyltransferase [Betaproteobacteria bacterium]|nr:class I SAM-dependent methyltransferase [Betaproteobacteria bacterium]